MLTGRVGKECFGFSDCLLLSACDKVDLDNSLYFVENLLSWRDEAKWIVSYIDSGCVCVLCAIAVKSSFNLHESSSFSERQGEIDCEICLFRFRMSVRAVCTHCDAQRKYD